MNSITLKAIDIKDCIHGIEYLVIDNLGRFEIRVFNKVHYCFDKAYQIPNSISFYPEVYELKKIN